MSEVPHRPASRNELEREASEWELRMRDPRDWLDAPEAIPRVAPSTPISLRVPTHTLGILKAFARREGVGYQVLLKHWLDDRIREEHDKLAAQQAVGSHAPELARGDGP